MAFQSDNMHIEACTGDFYLATGIEETSLVSSPHNFFWRRQILLGGLLTTADSEETSDTRQVSP